MKKLGILVMAMVLSLGILAGCSSSGGSSSSAASTDSSASASASASKSSASASASSSSASIETGTAQSYIAIDDAEKLIGDSNTVFVDLRKADDYSAGHIEGAISAPMDAAVDGNDYDAATKEMKSALGSDLDSKDLVLVCYKGKKYAQAGTDVLNAMGADMTKVKTLEGGMEAWNNAGKALEGASAGASEDPTPDNPIIVDKEKGEIRYLGFVDGAYVGDAAGPTRHAVVFEGGTNGHKTIITGYGDEKAFYQGCIDLGWEPGNNLTLENQKGTMGGQNPDNAKTIEGEKLDVTIRWNGQDKEIPIWDCFAASNGDTREADWRFGGNIDRANEKNTGCVLCIDSCAVGIVSNAAWPSGTTDADGVTYFYGKPDVLPADHTDVVVTFRKAA